MANVSQKTLQWLYNVIGKEYRDSNRAYSDIAQTLERFPTLSPRTDVYTFENGSSALLLHLVGTLPAYFRNMTYRFPLELWIPHTYPYEPPIVYVTPTRDMLVRPGRHVSGEGRVYHPYLAHWAQAVDRSSIVELLSILSDIFSKEPPVVARQQGVNGPQQSPRPPPLPPHPSEPSRTPLQGPTGSTSPPAPPPLPPKQQLGADAEMTPKSSPLGRYDAPPPLPDDARATSSQSPNLDHTSPRSPISQFRPQRHTSLSQSMTPQYFPEQQDPNHTMSPRGVHNMRFSTPASGLPPQHAYRMNPQLEGRLSSPYNAPPQPGLPHHLIQQDETPLQAGPSQHPPHSHPDRNFSNQYQQQPVQPKPAPQPKPPPVNLLDSPFDITLPATSANITPPPIPPNPEKDALLSALSQSITQTLHNQITQNTSSLPLLRSQNEALTHSLHTLESELSQLQSLQSTLTSNISTLQSSLHNADKCISSAHARAQRGDIPKIDDMLTAPTVVGKQLYDVVCDERGIEASIWALQAALVRARIGTEVWARKTRELSREGFRRMVLSRKIAAGMGLEV